MGLRATSTFYNLSGQKFVVEIHRAGFTGSAHNFEIVSEGLNLEYDTDTNDVHDEIVSSAVTLTIVARTADDETLLDDLKQYGEAGHRLKITRDWVGTTTQYPWWHGVILDDIAVVDALPRIVELNFTDDLGLLGEVLYKSNASTEYADQTNCVVVLARCLSKLRWFDEVHNATSTAIKILEYVSHDDIQATPAAENIIANHERFRNPDDNGEFQYFDSAKILRETLRMLQSRIMLSNGVFHVVPSGIAVPANNLWTFDNYLKTGAKDTAPDLISNTDFQGTTNYQTYGPAIHTIGEQQTGLEFGSLPPLSEVKIRHEYDGLKYDWFGPTGIDLGSNWFGVNAYGNDTTTQVGEVVTLTFGWAATLDGDLTTLEGARAKISFRLRHGSRYAKRTGSILVDAQGDAIQSSYTTTGGAQNCFDVVQAAPEYSAASASTIDVWLPVFYRAEGLSFVNGAESITFPPLDVSTGTTEIQSPSIQFFGADGTTYAEGATVQLSYIYQMHGAAIAEGDSIIYRRTNQDAAARENLDLGDILLGDRVSNFGSPQTLNWAINGSGGYAAATMDWNNANFPSTSQPIASLICWDRLALRLNSCRTIMATVRSPFLSQFHRLRHDGDDFILTATKYNAERDFWTLEGVAYNYDTNEPTGTNSDSASLGNMGLSAGRNATITTGQFSGLVQKVSQVQQIATDLSKQQADIETGAETRVAALTLPDLADTNIPSTPTTGHFLKWDGTNWRAAAVTGGGGASEFDDLSDVDVGSAVNGQIVKYNANDSEWQLANNTFANLGDVNPSLSPAPGDLLLWTTLNGGQWSSTTVSSAVGSQIDLGNLGNVTDTATGTAGNILLDFALAGAPYWISQPITTATNSHVDIDDLKNVGSTSPTTGDVLTYDGTNWNPSAPTGGGSTGPIPLVNISGRWQWSSADDGERVLTGQTSYGPFNWYSHTNEPNTTTIRVYNAAHVVGTTSGNMSAYYANAFGVRIPTTDKKLRVDFQFRIQNAPSGSEWGMSIWGCATPANGTTGSVPFTLRGVSSTVTTTTTSSIAFYHSTFTTAQNIGDSFILPMFENRAGSLTSSVYIYGQVGIYLVD